MVLITENNFWSRKKNISQNFTCKCFNIYTLFMHINSTSFAGKNSPLNFQVHSKKNWQTKNLANFFIFTIFFSSLHKRRPFSFTTANKNCEIKNRKDQWLVSNAKKRNKVLFYCEMNDVLTQNYYCYIFACVFLYSQWKEFEIGEH